MKPFTGFYGKIDFTPKVTESLDASQVDLCLRMI
jgi:hypothetical protein